MIKIISITDTITDSSYNEAKKAIDNMLNGGSASWRLLGITSNFDPSKNTSIHHYHFHRVTSSPNGHTA